MNLLELATKYAENSPHALAFLGELRDRRGCSGFDDWKQAAYVEVLHDGLFSDPRCKRPVWYTFHTERHYSEKAAR